jgi:hypothetical protein
MMFKVLATISIIALASAANATVYDDCTRATKAGDKEAALTAATKILSFVPAPRYLPDEVFQCLDYATGLKHSYDPASGKILSEEGEIEEAARAKAFAEQIDEKRTKAEERRVFLLKNSLQIAKMKEARELVVNQRLVEGCRAMFKKEPDQTITNKMCYDVFMIVGLPN